MYNATLSNRNQSTLIQQKQKQIAACLLIYLIKWSNSIQILNIW